MDRRNFFKAVAGGAAMAVAASKVSAKDEDDIIYVPIEDLEKCVERGTVLQIQNPPGAYYRYSVGWPLPPDYWKLK